MQTIIFLLLLFLGAIASVLLYFNNKNSRINKLTNGECPNCGQKRKTFYDEKTKTNFEFDVISSRLLKNHGCSGTNDIEFSCKHCGLKEVHSLNNQSSCGI